MWSLSVCFAGNSPSAWSGAPVERHHVVGGPRRIPPEGSGCVVLGAFSWSTIAPSGGSEERRVEVVSICHPRFDEGALCPYRFAEMPLREACQSSSARIVSLRHSSETKREPGLHAVSLRCRSAKRSGYRIAVSLRVPPFPGTGSFRVPPSQGTGSSRIPPLRELLRFARTSGDCCDAAIGAVDDRMVPGNHREPGYPHGTIYLTGPYVLYANPHRSNENAMPPNRDTPRFGALTTCPGIVGAARQAAFTVGT
ncbi:hypothetical protein Uis4E_1138 [Bifidobacterium parmae]|uniref:Uncharacterized protein n=1 Tax=Bifidobacterium parmae TaxID=361854 RepID=A0A2N5J3H2_9BIFI|nr:hypothetical protein Uis4E_1138 [Bifidobacterium parmae]